MAWLGLFAAGSREFLSHAVTPSRRGGRLSAATRSPLAGADRAHADRLCAGRLPASLAGAVGLPPVGSARSEEHTSELQSQSNLVCRLLLEKKKNKKKK